MKFRSLDNEDKDTMIVLSMLGLLFCFLGFAYKFHKMSQGEFGGYNDEKSIALLLAASFCLFSLFLFSALKKFEKS